MKKKYYYIFYGNIFTSRDWDRLGCDYFSQRGYQVVPVELVSFLQPEYEKKLSRKKFNKSHVVQQVANKDEIKDLVSTISPSDLVILALRINVSSLPVFEIFTRHKVNYSCITLGNLPTRTCRFNGNALTFWEYLLLKFLDIRMALSGLKTILFTMFGGGIKWYKLRPPTWWICAGSLNYRTLSLVPWPWHARIISVPSFDTQIADQLIHNPPPSVYDANTEYAVLLDDGFLDHPDFLYMNIKCPITKEKYSQSIKLLIAKIESDLGLKLIIAGHPKSDPLMASYIFSDALFIQNKTPELVLHSKLVVTSCSTAISYAVRMRKPLIFYTTDEIEKSDLYKGFLSRMSSWFGMRRINIDHLKDTPALEIPKINEKYYSSYETSFLLEKGVKNHVLWGEVAHQHEKYILQYKREKNHGKS